MHINYCREIKHSPMGRMGLIIVAFWLMISFLAPFLVPYDPGAHSREIFLPPNGSHLLGTNDVGQDVWGANYSRNSYIADYFLRHGPLIGSFQSGCRNNGRPVRAPL